MGKKRLLKKSIRKIRNLKKKNVIKINQKF